MNMSATRKPIRHLSLIKKFIRMFKCDTARIISPMKTHYLIIGHKKNTLVERRAGRDCGQWHDANGNTIDFNFIHEDVVASGKTLVKLMESAKRYKQLLRVGKH